MASPCVVTLLFWTSQFLHVRVPQAVLLFTFSSQVFSLFNYSGSQSAVNVLFMLCKYNCENCSVILLANISKCYGCSELEGCLESMKSDLVLEDLAADITLKCITEHPGFNSVCLQKWSLRLATAKFKTKGKQQYRQNGSEERLVIKRGNDYTKSLQETL